MNLLNLAAKYQTDKLEHGYIPFYEATLPKHPLKLLEIGIKQGASMRMWQEYFPDTELHGLDLFEEYQPPEDVNAIWHKGHQADYYLLEQLVNYNFDIIIDDGSHLSRHQMMTFFGLFKSGCHYYIEDLQCCDEEFYRCGLPFIWTAKGLSAEINDMASSCRSADVERQDLLIDNSIHRPYERGIYTNSSIILMKC